VLEVSEHERRSGDIADLLRAGAHVLEDTPALCQQREAAFTDASWRPQQRIVGTSVDI
jgi:hypothetical protein